MSNDPRVEKLIWSLDLSPAAARDAVAQFEFAELTVIDAADDATVEVVSGAIWTAFIDGTSRRDAALAVLAALAKKSQGETTGNEPNLMKSGTLRMAWPDDQPATTVPDGLIDAGFVTECDPEKSPGETTARCTATMTHNGIDYRCGLSSAHVEGGPRRHMANILRGDGSTWSGDGAARK